MKETQFAPKAEIIRFPEQDIITTSGGYDGGDVTMPTGGGPGIVLPDDEL